MNAFISIVSILLCVFSLDAQIATTLRRLPSGSEEVSIRNNSGVSLVAFVVTVSQTPGNPPIVVYSDQALVAGRRTCGDGER